MSLEDLREFLQEKIASSFNMSDDVVIEHLQSSMSELRRIKLDLPPPGTVDIMCDVIPIHPWGAFVVFVISCYV